MHKCFTPCIYYREVYDKTKKPSMKIICDYKDTEIFKMPEDDINFCKQFTTYKQTVDKMRI